MADRPLHISQAMESAWQAYREGIEEVRQIIFAHPFAEGSGERDEANYLFFQLQAEAFNIAMAPRPDYPRFYPVFEPLTFTWGLPCPDFIYSRLYLDGRRTYRITGKRSNSLSVVIQSINAHFTLPPNELKLLGDFSLDKFKIDADGRFEIILSADPHDGNWIPLDPASDRNFILFREVIADWELHERSEMRIDPIDEDPPRPIIYGEPEMIRRMEGAVRVMKALVNTISIGPTANALQLAGGPNRFADLKVGGAAAAASDAAYSIMRFEVGPDEALIIELEPPNPLFWNIQLGDTWNQALDYTYHQASLSMTQASADDDGKVRLVLSHRDPGVRNWLDPVSSHRGVAMARWYFPRGPVTPTTRLAPFAEINQLLPTTTARITPEERQAALNKRRRGLERRRNL